MRVKCLPCLLMLVCCIGLCCSCNGNKDTFDDALLETENVCLKVGKTEVFVYNPLDCQLASSNDAKTFRAFKDDASDYFILKLGDVPTEAGQKIHGCSVSWTTEDDIVTKEDLSFQVRQADAYGSVWLWCPSAKIFALVRIL